MRKIKQAFFFFFFFLNLKVFFFFIKKKKLFSSPPHCWGFLNNTSPDNKPGNYKKSLKKKKGKDNTNVNPLEAGKEERRRSIEGCLEEFITLMIACNKPKTPPQPHPDGSSTKLQKKTP